MDVDYARVRALHDKLNAVMHLAHRLRLPDSMPTGVFGILAFTDEHCRRTGQPHIRMGQLCHALHRSMPAVTRSVGAMAQEGLVEKTLSQEDRRVVYVSLTPRGRAMLEHAQALRFGVIDDVLDQLGQQDTAQLLAILDKLTIILSQSPRRPCPSSETGKEPPSL